MFGKIRFRDLLSRTFFWIAPVAALVSVGSMLSARVAAERLTPQQQLAFDIYKELVEINTVTATGDTARAAEAMAARLRAAGFADPTCTCSRRRRARAIWSRGCAAPVRASRSCCSRISTWSRRGREDWSVDPFKLIEKDGYFYARGSGDDNSWRRPSSRTSSATSRRGYKPDRDIIVALTDEEIPRPRRGDPVAAQEPPRPDRCRIRAQRGRRRRTEGRQADPQQRPDQRESLPHLPAGGEQSRRAQLGPVKDNAIYHLADGLARLSNSDFPVKLNETTRAYFERTAQLKPADRGRHARGACPHEPDPAALSPARRPIRSITRNCAPPASPPCWRADTP